MTAITGAKSTIHIEETQYKAAVSESTMTKIGAAINWVNENAGDVIGMIMSAYLTEAQFASLKGYDHTIAIADRRWAIMSGQTIAGSDFSTLTGITTLPDMTTASRYLRQAGSLATLGQSQSSQNLDHTHQQSFGDGVNQYPAYRGSGLGALAYESNSILMSSNNIPLVTIGSGGSETRPNSFAINYFIKINND